MKKSVLIVCLCFMTLIKGFAQENNIVEGNIIVLLNATVSPENFVEKLKNINGVQTHLQLERTLSQEMNIYLLKFDEQAIDRNRMLQAVNSSKEVKIAQFNHVFHERNIPNDSLFGSMWNLNNTGQNGGTADADIDAVEAWDITTGGLTAAGDTIVVAIVDGGFDLAHQDLSFWKNNNEIPGDSIDNDGNGYVDDYKGWNGATANDNIPVMSHGTHVSGIAGARGNNHIGVTGINWNVKIMAISYGSGSGTTLEANAVAGYAYVVRQRRLYNETNGTKGAFVVSTNSSFGIDNGQPSAYPMWCAMYDSLGAVGVLSAAATANNNVNVDVVGDIPTACPSDWLITVTNTTNADNKYGSAGYGATTIDLGAPGTNILSTYPTNTYFTASGTSMASPHIAGAIALMYSIPCPDFITACKTDPAGTALKVKDSLLVSVDSIASLNGITVTGGRLNINSAVHSILHYYCFTTSVGDIASATESFLINSIFPNPADEHLTIDYTIDRANPVKIFINNVLGQEIKSETPTQNGLGNLHYTMNISDLQSGIYFIHIASTEEKSNTIKVIVY